MSNGDVFISTRRAARNMSYQEMTPEQGKVNVLAEIQGQDLMGRPLTAPLTCYDVSLFNYPPLTSVFIFVIFCGIRLVYGYMSSLKCRYRDETIKVSNSNLIFLPGDIHSSYAHYKRG